MFLAALGLAVTCGVGSYVHRGYAELAAKTGVDGLNLDTMDSLGPFVVAPGQDRPAADLKVVLGGSGDLVTGYFKDL